jgi:hypothetical protein
MLVGAHRCPWIVVLGPCGHSLMVRWALTAKPSLLFVDGGAEHPWTFVGGCRHSLIVVVGAHGQSSMVMVGAC